MSIIARGSQDFFRRGLANLLTRPVAQASGEMEEFDKVKTKSAMSAERKSMVMFEKKSAIRFTMKPVMQLLAGSMPDHDPA